MSVPVPVPQKLLIVRVTGFRSNNARKDNHITVWVFTGPPITSTGQINTWFSSKSQKKCVLHQTMS